MLILICFLLVIVTIIIFVSNSIMELLISTICIFILSSLILALTGHILIASIYIIVYAGAILVMISIAYLITPAIKKKIKLKKQNKFTFFNFEELINKYFLYLFLLIFLITIFLIYFKSNNNIFNNEYIKPLNNIDSISNNLNFEFYNKTTDIQKLQKSLESNSKILNNISNIYLSTINLLSNTNVNHYNYNNSLSNIYLDTYTSFLTIGFYLFFILLVCLRMFIIMSKSIRIKRQDTSDQILKIWKK